MAKNSRHDSVVSQKFIYIFNAMALAETQIPLCPPFFKGGDVSEKALTPLCQRGEGEICVRNATGITSKTSSDHYVKNC